MTPMSTMTIPKFPTGLTPMPLSAQLVRLWVLTMFLLGGLSAWAQTPPALKPIPSLDVPRYLGVWYEVAKFPNWFQKKCDSDTSAQYSLRPDGQLQVLNQCRLKSGEMEQALGQARQIGGPSSATLQVRFAPAWLSFLPFVWGNYWVVDLDEGYSLAAVSEPSREYLWILSRSPVVDGARYAALLERLRAMGLDVGRLEKSVHQQAPTR